MPANGKLGIAFTPNIENPVEINGIEIIPLP